MKASRTIIIAGIALSSMLGIASARTWKSSDGAKTFEAKYLEQEGDQVTVLKGYKKLTFAINILSDEDQEWLKTQKEEDLKKAAEKVAEKKEQNPGALGKSMASKLKILSGKRYAKHTLEKSPEYYILYFSASW